jgi:hypothetical protein
LGLGLGLAGGGFALFFVTMATAKLDSEWGAVYSRFDFTRRTGGLEPDFQK